MGQEVTEAPDRPDRGGLVGLGLLLWVGWEPCEGFETSGFRLLQDDREAGREVAVFT